MTEIWYKKTEKSVSLKMKGHANYGEKGKDIVCAALSTLCLAMASAFDMYGIKYTGHIKEGDVEIEAEANDLVSKLKMRIVFETVVNALEGVEMEYPKNVKIIKLL